MTARRFVDLWTRHIANMHYVARLQSGKPMDAEELLYFGESRPAPSVDEYLRGLVGNS